MGISVLILASGYSKRMGTKKQLLKFNNLTFIENTIKQFDNDLIDEILIISNINEVKEIITSYSKTRYIENKSASNGMSESIKIGIKSKIKYNDSIITSCDLQSLDSSHIDLLIEKYLISNKKKNVCFKADSFTSPPAIILDKYLHLSENLKGEEGFKKLLTNKETLFIEVDSKYLKDIDTQKDYESLLKGDG